jgi:hypothetical protein
MSSFVTYRIFWNKTDLLPFKFRYPKNSETYTFNLKFQTTLYKISSSTACTIIRSSQYWTKNLLHDILFINFIIRYVYKCSKIASEWEKIIYTKCHTLVVRQSINVESWSWDVSENSSKEKQQTVACSKYLTFYCSSFSLSILNGNEIVCS